MKPRGCGALNETKVKNIKEESLQKHFYLTLFIKKCKLPFLGCEMIIT